MREILFKAKRVDNGKCVQGNLIQNNDESYIAEKCYGLSYCMECDRPFDELHIVDPKTLSQYTGLKDKHGNKVFENDVLKAYGSYELTVSWNDENAMFYAEYEGTKSGHEDDDNDDYAEACDFATYEIIGNKFDNKNF